MLDTENPLIRNENENQNAPVDQTDRLNAPLLDLGFDNTEIIDKYLVKKFSNAKNQYDSIYFASKIISYSFGGFASCVLYPLGKLAGEEIIAPLFSDTPTSENILGFYFGITAVVSGTLLVAQIYDSMVSDYLRFRSIDATAILQSRPNFSAENILWLLNWTFSIIAALPETNLSYQLFKDSMGVFALLLSAATLVMLSSKNNIGMVKLVREMFFEKYQERIVSTMTREQKTFHDIRESLTTALSAIEQKIDYLSDDEIADMHEKLSNERPGEQSVLLTLRRIHNENPELVVQQQQSEKLGNYIAKCLGGLVGALSCACFYQLGKDAGVVLADNCGVSDSNTKDIIGCFSGIGAVTFRGAINMYSNRSSFNTYYNYVKKKADEFKPGHDILVSGGFSTNSYLTIVLYSLAVIFSFSGGSTRLAMADQAFGKDDAFSDTWILLAFIGGSSLYFWALNKAVSNVLSTTTNRSEIKSIVTSFKTLLPDLKDECVASTSEFLLDADDRPSDVMRLFPHTRGDTTGDQANRSGDRDNSILLEA